MFHRPVPVLGLMLAAGVMSSGASYAQPRNTDAVMALSAGGQSDCRNRDVRIDGDGQSYNLLGGCRSLTITGSQDSVHAELQSGATINAGHGNRIFWFTARGGAAPAVVDAGTDSQVLQEQRLGSSVLPSSATPPPEHALVLAGEKPVTEADCAGRDAVINADNTKFVLRGRCRSVSLSGNHDVVEIEMLAGSRIRINGDHSVVQFVLVSAGPDPIVSVEGEKSAAWRVQRLGATDRLDASRGVTPTPNGMAVHGGIGASVDQMKAVPEQDAP